MCQGQSTDSLAWQCKCKLWPQPLLPSCFTLHWLPLCTPHRHPNPYSKCAPRKPRSFILHILVQHVPSTQNILSPLLCLRTHVFF